MVSREQIAHDLSLVYLNNRFGAEVVGSFTVDTMGDEVSGSGSVQTARLPEVDKIRFERVPTGEKWLGIVKKSVAVENGFEVDPTFERIIVEYHRAFRRFMTLLEADSADSGDLTAEAAG